MEALKKAVSVKGKLVYDVETLFSRLMVLGPQHSMDVAEIFQFELSPVPTALIDEYGCLRKGNKATALPRCLVSGLDCRTPGCKLRHSTGPLSS